MYKMKLLAMVFMLMAVFNTSYAQQAGSVLTNKGTVKGIARDTAQNYVLKSATVSIYKVGDSSLLTYQITNSSGEFIFKNIPVNVSLILKISSVGYSTAQKAFKISSDNPFIDLKTIVVNRENIMLEDVVISIPPISMNGDTLEFNAAAFKLDTNATVEDLMRAIPNITIWGDGKITVNGAEIKSLKVNGKSFFGADSKIAIQNIPKNALSKIQVYNKLNNLRNPLDSALEMNLKLKKGKDIGYFGKVSGGYATKGRYDIDASLNTFTSKMQFALVGATNNINKMPNSINSLMSNSTFKGISTNIEYQPDFSQVGLNQSQALGASLNYSFIDNPSYDKKNSLNTDYFMQNRNGDFSSELITTTAVGPSDQNYERINNINQTKNINQHFTSGYEFISKAHDLRFFQSININNGDRNSDILRNAGNSDDALSSINNTSEFHKYFNKNLNLEGEYSYSPYYNRKRFRGFRIGYKLNAYNNDSERSNKTNFIFIDNAALSQKFDRRFNTTSKELRQDIDFTLRELKTLLIGNKRLPGFDIDFINKLSIRSNKNIDAVTDLDTLSNIYYLNRYLNNRIKTNIVEGVTGFKLQKTFSYDLSNRFSKNLTFTFHPKYLLSSQDNRSEHSFQNIKRQYKQFAPDAGISYKNHQYGEYSLDQNISYSTTLRIPNINQLAPLTDSSNVYDLQRGNIKLKEAVQREVTFSLSYYDERNKNSFNCELQINAGLINQNIVDSIFIDQQNRRTTFLVNADGHRYANMYGNLKKAYKLNSSAVQVSLSSALNYSKNPSFVNTLFTFSNNVNTNSNASINYIYKSLFALEIGQSFATYYSKQQAFNIDYRGRNLGTKLSMSYNLNTSFTVNSNVTFNNSASPAKTDLNFTIWNANAVYRFLKGNNAEVKFSALDLLHQNSGIINYGSSNSFTTGRQKVLTQYFMASLAYYPRKFGKKENK